MRFALAVLLLFGLTPVGIGANRQKPAPPTYDPGEVNNSSQPVPKVKKGAPILRAQILLSRAGFSAGELDGAAAKNFSATLRAFQESKSLQPTGTLNEETWTALNADPGPVVIPYTLTAEDVSGPYEPVPDDMMEMAKLKRVNYASVEEALAEKFHVSVPVLQGLNQGKKFEAGTEIMVADTTRPAAAKVQRLVVTKSPSAVMALDESGKVVRFYVASSGSEHDPLPVGEWKITAIVRDPPFHYNPELFWDADAGHSKAKIPPGPNNPVGAVWLDLTKDHYGIHGTPNPATVGHAQSHGCIRLTNWDVLELADLVTKDMPVIMRER